MPADGTLAACFHARTSARPASMAVLKSSRFRGREEYGSASQLGQQRLRRLGRYGSPCPHLPLSGHRLGSPPPPTLRERRHRVLARRLVASARAYVGFLRENVAEYDIAEVCHRSRGRLVIRCPILA